MNKIVWGSSKIFTWSFRCEMFLQLMFALASIFTCFGLVDYSVILLGLFLLIVEFANSVDSDGAAHNEPPHLDLSCLPSRF